jgi:hypothetical protein
VDARFPFHAVYLKIPNELATYFVINDIRFDTIIDSNGTSRSISHHISPSPVTAAAFSDEGVSGADFNMDCKGVTISVTNVTKKKHVFRAAMIGFRRD